MKRIFSRALLFVGAVMLLTGCNSKMSQFAADYFSCNPNPLEVVGTQVPATVTANVPAKFFKKNAEVTVTPVLVYAGGEATSTPYMFQGEKVRGNATTISYDGGAYTIPVNFTYQPAMQKSELFLDFAVKQGSKTYALPRVKVANGVIATAALADAGSVNPAIAPDKFQRIINEKYTADILFLINQANIRANQLTTAQMEAFNADVKKASQDTSRVIEDINISSYASPDGPWAFNNQLAQKREATTNDWLTKKLKKEAINDFGEITKQFTAEDWEGFKKLVEVSDIQDKQLILSVLSMYKDPEEREREIHNLSNVFEQLAETILPQLRYSRLTASVNVIGKSDEQINAFFDNDPAALSIDEILYAATLTDDNGRQQAIYKKASELFPNDYRTYNNLGMAQYRAGDFNAAKTSFAKAAQIAPNAGETQMNIGLLAMLNGDYAAANRAFGNAGGVPELSEALGVYYLKQGDAAAAVKAFGGSKSNNAALAQIITKDYGAARSTLASITEPDAVTYYLTAILGARTNNSQLVTSNLRQAIKIDQNLAKQAVNDLEFAKFNLQGVLNN
ncbi:MAG: tetratricopeptide repeat protein [Pseudoflavonifractor sp.]|nr:tetratricopeptide repeat protein [Alloprevotella sp.]MCM1116572.1 tetratricopeptide repeat protein [Pseudoflavonifractor sp.]